MSALYNDGTVQYGSRVWVVRTAADDADYGTYVADNISINRPTKAIDRTNELGEPSGSVDIADFVTGSATLQLSSSTVKEPLNGQIIKCNGSSNAVLDATGGIGSETFFITSVSRAEGKDSEKKVTINFKKKYN